MEEKVEIQESHEPERSLEEERYTCKETNQENAPVSVHKQSHQLENTKEVESGDRDGNMENHKTLAKNQDQVSEGEKVGETKTEKRVISSQKPKAGPKQNQKAKHTVPQPLSLATEKRMSRERRGESENRTLSLSKSASLNMNHRVHTQTSQRVELERSSELRNGTGTKSTSQHGNRTERRIEKEKIQNVVESKKSKGTAKEEEKDLEVKNVGKSTTFKALPLPSFYRKKAPPKQELRKIPLTRPKSPVFHQRSKSISDSIHQRSNSISELGNNQSDAFNRSSSVSVSGNNKVDEVTKNSSKKSVNKGATISETRATKVEPIQKNASRTISSSAKEALNKLLRGTWRTSKTKTQ